MYMVENGGGVDAKMFIETWMDRPLMISSSLHTFCINST